MVTDRRVAVALVLCALAAMGQRLSDEEIKAREFALSGVRIGMSQNQVAKVAPRARRMADVASGTTGPFVSERGQERWSIEARGRSSGVAYFEFIDSSLYAMSWAFPRASYRGTVKSMIKTIGYAQRRTQTSQTWRFDAISRQIVVRKAAEGGVRISVVDFRRASDIIAYRDSVAAAGQPAPQVVPGGAEGSGGSPDLQQSTTDSGTAEAGQGEGAPKRRDLDTYLKEQGW